MARLVVSAVIGVAVGYFSGNPQLGFAAFSLAYGVTAGLDPNSKVLGPKLTDLKAPTASYGSPIAYLEGAPRLAGTFFWSSDKRSVANTSTSGGKGGPGVDSTTYTYEMDVLIGLAINQCSAIRRVWSNGKLVWSNADDADAQTIAASQATTAWRDMRFYPGSLTQLPDPVYEAAVGVGNAPGYRGRCCVFIEGLNLGGSGQLPVLTFEVLTESAASVTVETLTTVSQGDARSYIGGIPAMSLDGFDLMIAVYDATLLQIDTYNVYSIAADGTSTLTGAYPVSSIDSQVPYTTAHGNSDVSCLVTNNFSASASAMYLADGSSVEFDFSLAGVTGAAQQTLVSRFGSSVVFGGYSGFSKKLLRYNVTTGGFLVASAAMAENVNTVAINSTDVYALALDGTTIYHLDLASMTLQGTFAPPVVTAVACMVCDADGTLFWFGTDGTTLGHSIWSYNGSTWTNLYPSLGTLIPDPLLDCISVSNGAYMSQRYDVSSASQIVRYAAPRVAIVLPTLDQVVSRLCVRTGQLSTSDIDVTALATQTVRGMAISQVSTTRSAIEGLMAGYLFEAVESDVLRFVLRGGSAAATVPFADMGAGPDQTAEPFPKRRMNDIEVPALLSVKYANTTNDFQDGLESGDRLVTESTAVKVVEVPLGFTPTEAKRLADANTMDMAVSLLQIGPIALTRAYAAIEPTDVLSLVDSDGSIYRGRVIKATLGIGTCTFELVLDDATAINSAAATDSTYTASSLVRQIASTRLALMDIPILRDADNAPGIYAAMGATGTWPGAELDRSPDNVTFTKSLTDTSRATMGTASTTLGDFTDGNVFDEVNSLTVIVGDGTLASSNRAAMLAGTSNAMLVGSEIIQFRDATLVTAGTYTLTGFLRGRRGTEWAMSSHTSGERVVLLEATTLRRVADSAADKDVPVYWKAITIGKSASSVTSQAFTDTGISQKPFAPVDLRVDRSDGFVVTWNRRSRLASLPFATSQPPLGETTESYDVELSSGLTLVDSQTVTSASYSASQLAGGLYLNAPLWGGRVISTEFIGVREDIPDSTTQARYVARINADGSFSDESASIGQRVFQLDNIGDAIYVASDIYTNTVPSLIVSSQVYKFARTSLSSIGATYTAALGGDPAGLVSDGANIWISERTSNQIRKLNATTLASVATYAMATNPTGLFYTSGKVWVACWGSSQIARFDTGTLAEDLRFSCVTRPASIVVTASLVFVQGEDHIGVYNATTGVLVATHALTCSSGLPQRQMAIFGSYVAVVAAPPATATKVALIDGTTGALSMLASIPSPFALLAFIAGVDGSDLILCGTRSISGGSYETRRFQIASVDLSGYEITVYQNGSAGRGYPATLQL